MTHLVFHLSIHPFIHPPTHPFIQYIFIEYLLCTKSSARSYVLRKKRHQISNIDNKGSLASYKSKFVWVNRKSKNLGWKRHFCLYFWVLDRLSFCNITTGYPHSFLLFGIRWNYILINCSINIFVKYRLWTRSCLITSNRGMNNAHQLFSFGKYLNYTLPHHQAPLV